MEDTDKLKAVARAIFGPAWDRASPAQRNYMLGQAKRGLEAARRWDQGSPLDAENVDQSTLNL